jgi:phage minor structural protein
LLKFAIFSTSERPLLPKAAEFELSTNPLTFPPMLKSVGKAVFISSASEFITLETSLLIPSAARTAISPFLSIEPARPLTSISPQLALERIFANTSSKHGFKCRTDLSAPRAFSVSKPMSIRACLGGTEGSVLDVWGGEYEWDMFDVILHSKRGKDNGVVIEYGKNLTSLEQDNDFSSVYTHLLPYAVVKNGDTENVVTLSEAVLPVVEKYAREKTLIKDFSSFFKDGETVTEDTLRAKAKSYIKQNPFGDETPTVKVSFEPLWQQPEYSQFLEKVNLCDTVTVRHPDMNIEVKTKVIETVYDALAEKYSSITLGTAKSNFVNTVAEIKSTTDKIKKETDSFPLLMNTAIKNATSLISGQQGGFVVMHTDSVTGKPYELLILDNENLYDARNVWRWNVGGLGFSKSGYNGPYETAITADGKIVADFITSGTLMANIIKAGVISSADNSSWWDLESGEVHLSAYTKTEDTDKLSDSIAEITERTSTLEQTAEDISFKINEQSKCDECSLNAVPNLFHKYLLCLFFNPLVPARIHL